MEIADYHKMIRDLAEGCETPEQLADLLAALLSRGTIIDVGPDGRERVTFARFLVDQYRGLRIVIHPNDHLPPHFHVEADGINARFSIETGEYLRGDIGPRERRIVREWYDAAARERLTKVWRATRPSDPAIVGACWRVERKRSRT